MKKKGPYTKPHLARTVFCPKCGAVPGEQCRDLPDLIVEPDEDGNKSCHGERHRAYLATDEAWLARQATRLDAELAGLLGMTG